VLINAAFVYTLRIKQNDDHLIDLHGLTVAEAQVLIKEAVTQWWSRSQMQSCKSLYIFILMTLY
jgi:hypothetical protein